MLVTRVIVIAILFCITLNESEIILNTVKAEVTFNISNIESNFDSYKHESEFTNSKPVQITETSIDALSVSRSDLVTYETTILEKGFKTESELAKHIREYNEREARLQVYIDGLEIPEELRLETEKELRRAINEYILNRKFGRPEALPAIAVYVGGHALMEGASYAIGLLFNDEEFDPYTLAGSIIWGGIKGVISFYTVIYGKEFLKAALEVTEIPGALSVIDEFMSEIIGDILEFYVNAIIQIEKIKIAALKSLITGNQEYFIDSISPIINLFEDKVDETDPPIINELDYYYLDFTNESVQDNVFLLLSEIDYDIDSESHIIKKEGEFVYRIEEQNIPTGVVLSLRSGNLSGGYAPINISINGNEIIGDFDVAQVNANSNEMHISEFQIANFLKPGVNDIVIEASEPYSDQTPNFLQTVQIFEGETYSEIAVNDKDYSIIDVFSTNNYNIVGEQAEIVVMLYNSGREAELIRQIRLSVNGNEESTTTTIPILSPGQLYPVKFNVQVTDQDKFIEAEFSSSQDQNSSNNYSSFVLSGIRQGILEVDGQGSYTKNLSMPPNSIINQTVQLYNSGSDALELTSNVTGTDNSVVTSSMLNNFTLEAGEIYEFVYQIDNTNSSKEQLSFNLNFETEFESYTIINLIDVIPQGSQELEWEFDAGYQIDGDGTGQIIIFTGPSGSTSFNLDNDPNSTAPLNIEYDVFISNDQFKSLSFSSWSYNVDELDGSGRFFIRHVESNEIEQTSSSGSDSEDILEWLRPGTNTFRLGLTNISTTGNDTEWRVNSSSVGLPFTNEIWESPEINLSAIELQNFQDSWEEGNFFVRVENVLNPGKVYLFINGEMVDEEEIDDDRQFRLRFNENDIEENNVFMLKADPFDRTKLDIEYFIIEMEYYQGTPNVLANKTISKDTVLVGENFTVLNSLQNVGDNNAIEVSYDDSNLNTLFNYVSGNLKDDFNDIEPNEEESFNYSLNSSNSGVYIFGGSEVQFTNQGVEYSSTFNQVTITVMIGDLFTELVAVESGEIPNQYKISARVFDSSQNSIIDADVNLVVQNPDLSQDTLLMSYDAITQMYHRNIIISQSGEFNFNSLAQKEFYYNGTSEIFSANLDKVFLDVDFYADTLIGVAPFEVMFYDNSSSSSNISTWNWDFDNDGSTDSNAQNPKHIYNTPGIYTIKLAVEDNNFAKQKLKENYVVVQIDTISDPTADITPLSDLTQTINQEYWVEVKVGENDEVEDLFGISFKLNASGAGTNYVVDSAEDGGFLGNSVIPFFEPVDDQTVDMAVTKTSGSGVSGSGVIARAKFTSTQEGIATFSLLDFEALDSNGNPIIFDINSLEIEITAGVTVWPGDTNHDGVVSSFDVLFVGQCYGEERPGENNPGNQWRAYLREDWVCVCEDANGDGVVDGRDILPIGLNYGKTHDDGANTKVAISQLAVLPIESKSTVILKDGFLNITFELTDQIYGLSGSISSSFGLGSTSLIFDDKLTTDDYLSFTKVNEETKTIDFALSSLNQNEIINAGNELLIKIKVDESEFLQGEIEFSKLNLVNTNGEVLAVSGFKTDVDYSSNEEIDKDSPFTLSLSSNYPNPFNPSTTIKYTLDKKLDIQLSVYSMSGQLITTLVEGNQAAGEYSVVFDASGLASGNYIYRLEAGNKVLTRSMTLIK